MLSSSSKTAGRPPAYPGSQLGIYTKVKGPRNRFQNQTGGGGGFVSGRLNLTSRYLQNLLRSKAIGQLSGPSSATRVYTVDVNPAVSSRRKRSDGGGGGDIERGGSRRKRRRDAVAVPVTDADVIDDFTGVPKHFFSVRRNGAEMRLLAQITMLQVTLAIITTFVIGIMFILDPVASWQARKLSLPLLNGGDAAVVTWHQTVALPAITAASFVAAFVQINNPRSAHTGVKTGVNYMLMMETLFTDPLLMATLAVLAGVSDVFTVTMIMFSTAASNSVSFVSDVVFFLFRMHNADTASAVDDNAADSSRQIVRVAVGEDPHRKLRVLSALSALVVRSFIVVVWSQNAGLPNAGTLYGLTRATSGMLITTLVVYMVCDVLKLIQLNGWCCTTAPITRTSAHLVATCKFVRFAITISTIAVVSAEILSV